MKETVARFLERSVVHERVIILHEQPNQGMVIIEKLERYSDVSYAVVLLTGDDEVQLSGGASEARARQNVIMELGWFTGKLGRSRVCALYVDGVTLPTDFDGVLYTKFDANGAWKSELLRELEAAGVEVDWKALS
ncbi:MAG: hypothetical protein JWR04_1662 [Rhodoglobus sp.]|nr:hypothetical protein [Rhodoglobus sp.]